jgi:hypothetical protein
MHQPPESENNVCTRIKQVRSTVPKNATKIKMNKSTNEKQNINEAHHKMADNLSVGNEICSSVFIYIRTSYSHSGPL